MCTYVYYAYVCESWWPVSPTRNVWAHGSWTYTLSCVYKHIQYIFILVWLHTCLRMSCSACIYVQFLGWINQVGPTNRPGLPWLQGGPNPCSTPASSAWTPARVNHQLLSAGGIYSVSLSDIYIYIIRVEISGEPSCPLILLVQTSGLTLLCYKMNNHHQKHPTTKWKTRVQGHQHRFATKCHAQGLYF